MTSSPAILRPEAAHAASNTDSPRGQLELSGNSALALAPLGKKPGDPGNDIPADELPKGWQVVLASNGTTYYVNERTHESQWEFPMLPPNWEERASAEGKVYYLNVLDGSSQWHWPEVALEYSKFQASAMIPGQMGQQDDAVSQQSNASETDDVDNVNAEVLLALQPWEPPPEQNQMALAAPAFQRQSLGPSGRQPPKWGVDRFDEQWIMKHKKMMVEKKAQARRWNAATHYMGVREFVRPYEMEDQDQNWAKQLDVVRQKPGNLKKQTQQLGHKCALDKEDLREVFPLIQQLEWTKWPNKEIFIHVFLRAMPVTEIFLHRMKPSKHHRSLLYLFFMSSTLLVATLLLLNVEAPVTEDVDASRRTFVELWGEFFSLPTDIVILVIAIFTDLVARIFLWWCWKTFFSFDLHVFQSLSEDEVRTGQMRYWHDLAETGATVCVAWALFCNVATIVLCALYPQPRPARVLQCALICFAWQHVVLPLLRSSASAFILIMARKNGQMDGILTLIPSIMDFGHVGVKTPEFLSWRTHRMVQEEQVLRRIHKEPPIVGAPRRKVVQETGELQSMALDNKGASDGEVVRSSFRALGKNRNSVQSSSGGNSGALAVEDVK